MVKRICMLLLFIAVSTFLFAETRSNSHVSIFTHLAWQDEWSLTGCVLGTINLRSPVDSRVQGHLQLMVFTLPEAPDVSSYLEDNTLVLVIPNLEQALIIHAARSSFRFRLPVTEDYSIGIITGIDRVPWGTGSVLNAGDLLYGEDFGSSRNLSKFGAVRDESSLLLSAHLPLGKLSFLEAAVLPDYSGFFPDIGFRIHRVFPQVSAEGSYLYKAGSAEHLFSISLKAPLPEGDVYASLLLRDDLSMLSGVWKKLIITAGVGYSSSTGKDLDLSFRAEGLLSPGYYIDEVDLMFYGEAFCTINQNHEVFARTFVQVFEDFGVSLVTGTSFKIYHGLAMQVFLQADFDNSGFESFRSAAGFSYRF